MWPVCVIDYFIIGLPLYPVLHDTIAFHSVSCLITQPYDFVSNRYNIFDVWIIADWIQHISGPIVSINFFGHGDLLFCEARVRNCSDVL